MWDWLSRVWHYVLFTTSDGTTIDVRQVVLVILLLVIGVFLSRWLERLCAKRLAAAKIRPQAAQAIERVVFYSLIVAVVMTALSLLHVPLTAFAFVSGAVAIGVGFGAQNIINNFISGWILMSESPVRIGDFVEVATGSGTVEKIGNRSTRIRRTDGVHMLVPNSQILETTVVNWTLIDQQIRSIVRVGVEYGSDVHLVASLIHQAVDEQPETKSDPEPRVVFEDFGDNALIFDAYFWCDVAGEREMRVIRSAIRFRISDLFNSNGIVIAFPQRDVHIDSAGPIPVRVLPNDEGSDGG